MLMDALGSLECFPAIDFAVLISQNTRIDMLHREMCWCLTEITQD
jgi:hypothetical protein